MDFPAKINHVVFVLAAVFCPEPRMIGVRHDRFIKSFVRQGAVFSVKIQDLWAAESVSGRRAKTSSCTDRWRAAKNGPSRPATSHYRAGMTRDSNSNWYAANDYTSDDNSSSRRVSVRADDGLHLHLRHFRCETPWPTSQRLRRDIRANFPKEKLTHLQNYYRCPLRRCCLFVNIYFSAGNMCRIEFIVWCDRHFYD